MKLILLGEMPLALDLIARWYFDEWGQYTRTMSVARIRRRLQKSLEPGSVHLVVLAVDQEEVVGAAEFKLREMIIYPEYEHWLGGVYVREDKRGNGVGSLLVADILERAQQAGASELYLQTEDLTGGLYCRHGFRPLHEVVHDGHRVLIMKRP